MSIGHGGNVAFLMMQARNPSIVPATVRQCSWLLDGAIPGSSTEPWAGVEVPEVLRQAVPKRQRHFRAGRYCAVEALRMLVPGTCVGAVGRSASGAPVWPVGVTGSITHTDDFVSAAAAWRTDVAALGIDTERIVPAARARELASLVAHPEELAAARAAGLDEARAFTLVFSAKEAIFKCLYGIVGRRFGFEDARVLLVHGDGTFRARIRSTLAPAVPAGTLLDGRFELEPTRVHTGVTLPAGRLVR